MHTIRPNRVLAPTKFLCARGRDDERREYITAVFLVLDSDWRLTYREARAGTT